MTLFCCDLSLNRPGVAIIKYDEKSYKAEVIYKEAFIHRKTKMSHGDKLTSIYNWLVSLLSEYKPDVLVREQSFSRFAAETKTLNKVVGVSDLIAWKDYSDTEFHEIAPRSIKKIITGTGNATKQEVANKLNEYVGNLEYKYDDESDAVAVGIAYLIENQFPIQMKIGE